MSSAPLSYEYEKDDYYCYPDSSVLKNKLNIDDEKALNEAEREITAIKTLELIDKPLRGELDFDYIKRLHKHLFSDIYDWAGELRKTDISKGNIFCQHELIEINAEVLFNELKAENYLEGLDKDAIVKRLAYYLGDLNTIHPFREGNGRVQRLFIRELASRVGYLVNFDGITPEEMIQASDKTFHYDYEMMEELIARVIKSK
jgi:cell filamentation protein fic, putative